MFFPVHWLKDIKGTGVVKKAVISLDMLILHEGQSTVTLYSLAGFLDTLNPDPAHPIEFMGMSRQLYILFT